MGGGHAGKRRGWGGGEAKREDFPSGDLTLSSLISIIMFLCKRKS